jgi:hypothetical protein
MLSPDMWAQGQNGRKLLMPAMPERSPSAIMSVVHIVLICHCCFLGTRES